MTSKEAPKQQRIDKWLWYCRIFKSRSLASKFVERGRIRLNRNDQKEKLTKPSQCIEAGDVITFSLHDRIRVLEVLSTGTRRGPATEAQTLYEDRSPPPPPKESPSEQSTPSRQKGQGRPTKRDRRAIDKLHGQ